MKSVCKHLPWFILLLLTVTGWSWTSGGIVYELFGGAADARSHVEYLKQFFQNFGAAAPMVYDLFVVVEVVVAPIPELMLNAPGGIVVGPLPDGGLSPFGNVIGAEIACSLTRTPGSNWLSRFFEPRKLECVQSEIEAHGPILVFLLRLNPLTSSDVVSYAAGFTRMPVWKVMLATGIGMAPLCFALAWPVESLMIAFPGLIYPLVLACLVYRAVVTVVVRKVMTAAH